MNTIEITREDFLTLIKAYRQLVIELGVWLKDIKKNEKNKEWFDSKFTDMVLMPEIGLSVDEANTLIKMSHKFGLLPTEELPSVHAMRFAVKKELPNDEETLLELQTLSLKDIKERHTDKTVPDTERKYRYEIMKRSLDNGNIRMVHEDEMGEALEQVNSNYNARG